MTGAVTLDNNTITNQVCKAVVPVEPVIPVEPSKPVIPAEPNKPLLPVVPTRPDAPKENQRENLPNVGISSNVKLYSSLITMSGIALLSLSKKRK